jgi:hypothetical protein
LIRASSRAQDEPAAGLEGIEQKGQNPWLTMNPRPPAGPSW